MGLAEARATIQEKGVKSGARGIDDTLGGGHSKVVIGADDEVVQGVLIIEAILLRASGFKDWSSERFA